MVHVSTVPPKPPATPPSTTELVRVLDQALSQRTPRAAERPGRASAVLLALFDSAAGPQMLLTKRSTELNHHPGQISLPGGRPEEVDTDLAATALRETHEELAISPSQIQLIGQLDEMHTIATDFVITPYVGLITGAFQAVPNLSEVSSVLEVPVMDVLRADVHIPINAGRLEVRYPLAGEDVWGATAHILRGFSRITRFALAECDEG